VKSRGEDGRNLALIACAGAVGLLGTLAVREIMYTAMCCSFSAPPIPAALPAPTVGDGHDLVPIVQLRRADLPPSAGLQGDRTLRIGSRSLVERSSPVIYVDGIRVRGPLPALMRDNASIGRIEFIKGPAAKSLYGTEASAGVIRIFTRNDRDAEDEPEEERRRRRPGPR